MAENPALPAGPAAGNPDSPQQPPEEKPKRGRGRPKGSKNKPREPEPAEQDDGESEIVIEDPADPFAGKPPPRPEGAKPRPEAQPDTTGQPQPVSEPAKAPTGKQPMGEEKARQMLPLVWLMMDGAAEFAAGYLMSPVYKAAKDYPDILRRVYELATTGVALDEADRATLEPFIVSELAKMEVEPGNDLMFAILTVYVLKGMELMRARREILAELRSMQQEKPQS